MEASLQPQPYPVQLDVEYPDRPLNRLTTFFRAFTIIPIAIVLGTVSGSQTYSGTMGIEHHDARGRRGRAPGSSARC